MATIQNQVELEGMTAYRDGLSPDDNPYTGCPLNPAWLNGWSNEMHRCQAILLQGREAYNNRIPEADNPYTGFYATAWTQGWHYALDDKLREIRNKNAEQIKKFIEDGRNDWIIDIIRQSPKDDKHYLARVLADNL